MLLDGDYGNTTLAGPSVLQADGKASCGTGARVTFMLCPHTVTGVRAELCAKIAEIAAETKKRHQLQN